MGAGLALGQQRGSGRLDGDRLDLRVLFLQVLAGAGNRAAGADACDEDVDFAVGVVPQLRAGGVVVDARVRLVGELGSQNRVFALSGDLVGLVHGALHAGGARSQDDLCAVGAQQDTALVGHGLGHGQHDVVTAGCAHQGQGDAGVAGRRLDDGAARLQRTGLFRRVHDGLTDAVLDGIGGIEELELAQNSGVDVLGHVIDLDQRGAADGVQDVLVDLCH